MRFFCSSISSLICWRKSVISARNTFPEQSSTGGLPRRLLLLALALLCFMSADQASRGCTHDTMVTSIVAGCAPDDRSLDATLRVSRFNGEDR